MNVELAAGKWAILLKLGWLSIDLGFHPGEGMALIDLKLLKLDFEPVLQGGEWRNGPPMFFTFFSIQVFDFMVALYLDFT